MEMTSLWKPQNGFHRDLEISHRTRDSHIPTADPLLLRKEKTKNDDESEQEVIRSTGRRIGASSATFRTGKNNCRQPAKVVDVDHSPASTPRRQPILRIRRGWTVQMRPT